MSSTLAKLRGASVTDLIGLSLVALVVLWLAVNFVKAPTEFINIGLIGLTTGTDLRCSSRSATRSSTASCS